MFGRLFGQLELAQGGEHKKGQLRNINLEVRSCGGGPFPGVPEYGVCFEICGLYALQHLKHLKNFNVFSKATSHTLGPPQRLEGARLGVDLALPSFQNLGGLVCDV